MAVRISPLWKLKGTLLRHPAVREVAIVGMPHDNGVNRPMPLLCCMQEQRQPKPRSNSLLAIIWRISKCRNGSSFVDELPKTATGKVQKYVLRGGRTAIATQ